MTSPLEQRLGLDVVPASARAPRRTGRHPLALVVHGDAPSPVEDALTVRVPLLALGPEPTAELWWTRERAEPGEHGGFRLARTSELLFGTIALDGDAIEASALRAYGELIELTESLGYPHLLRAWNVVPRIGEPVRGEAPAGAGERALDRYMLFCRGRAHAFEARLGEGFEARLCAATAVGGEERSLVVWFLASRTAGAHRENPRQVQAYRYPERYGPRPPAFARATLAPEELGAGLLVSGTASILDCDSVHVGDVDAQLAETMRNIGALVGAEAAPAATDVPYLKVYVRRPGDLDAIRRGLAPFERGGTRIAYVRADVCRPELLIEIEGLAIPSVDSPLVPCTDGRGKGR
jgi:chorismate lyase/3-hydroxybenzoate synthase